MNCIGAVLAEIMSGNFKVTGIGETIIRKDYLNYMQKNHPDKKRIASVHFPFITGENCQSLIVGKTVNDLSEMLDKALRTIK